MNYCRDALIEHILSKIAEQEERFPPRLTRRGKDGSGDQEETSPLQSSGGEEDTDGQEEDSPQSPASEDESDDNETDFSQSPASEDEVDDSAQDSTSDEGGEAMFCYHFNSKYSNRLFLPS